MMNTALVIASRELRERKRLFLIAVALAVLPFAATLLPGARMDRATSIGLVAATLAVATGAGTALAFGATTVAGELAQKRMSFYFSKPVSPAALWIGKAGAALVASLACFAIIAVPAVIATRGSAMQWSNLPYFAMIAIAFLFLISHAAATMTRSRSWLLALDFAFAVASVAIVLMLARPLVVGGAFELLVALGVALAVSLFAILAIAPVAQLSVGRTDIRRSHVAFSRVVWIAIAVVLASAAAFVAWVASVAPADLTRVHALVQSPASETVLVTGSTRYRGDYQPTLLFNVTTGAYDRIPAPVWWGAAISRDGSTVAWLQPAGLWGRETELCTRRISGGKNVATGIVVQGSPSFVLSDDGSRVAFASASGIVVYDLASRKLLASSPRSGKLMFFVTPNLLRVFDYARTPTGASGTFAIHELDIDGRKVVQTAQFVASAAQMPVSVSPDGSRMLLRREGILADARTGATLATIPPSDSATNTTSILRDGGAAAITHEANGAHLRVYTPAGALAHDVALAAPKNAWISGETTDGKLIVIGFAETPQPAGKGRTMFLIDLASGRIERTVANTRGPLPVWSPDPRLTQYRAGMKLAGVDADGRIVLW